MKKLLYLASSCSYPRLCPQPMAVEHLMTGPLEPTNAAYATAKLAGMELCRAYRQQHGRNFIVGIPANAFGPGDDDDPEDAHVIGALIRRMHEAKEQGHDRVTIWGSGTPRREFIFADDLADACLLVMRNYDDATPINLGWRARCLDRRAAQHATWSASAVGWNSTVPADGMPRKGLRRIGPGSSSAGGRARRFVTPSPLPTRNSRQRSTEGDSCLNALRLSLPHPPRRGRIADIYPTDKIQSPASVDRTGGNLGWGLRSVAA